MDLILENIRCFNGLHRIPTKPLTVLVGENSAGKTTFLAGVAAALSGNAPQTRRLNSPPFEMGGYENIATYRGGKGGRAKQFSIGFTRILPNGLTAEVRSTFAERDGLPATRRIIGRRGSEFVDMTVEGTTIDVHVALQLTEDASDPPEEFRIKERAPKNFDRFEPWFFQSILLNNVIRRLREREPKPRSRDAFELVYEFIQQVFLEHPSVLALAPVRSKPERTYDQLSDDFKPEGDHIPLILARLLTGKESSESGELRKALERFGADSGLFNNVSVKRKGSKPSDPFQITIKTSGPPRNIADVGYGVSQSLPVVVESVLAAAESTLLMQQPEVHLHPRAQAALGSFLARLVASKKKKFIVETHSDYLLDRIRQEVADRTMDPSEVQILFFERRSIYTKVHPIALDMQGNIVGAPRSYRKFFLEEQVRTLYGSDQKLIASER